MNTVVSEMSHIIIFKSVVVTSSLNFNTIQDLRINRRCFRCPRNIRSDVLPRPCADPDVLAAHRNACFVIADPNGPLKNCQAIVDPEASFQACVYDQCAYNGDPKQKDRIISSYILTCLDEDEDQNEGNVTITVPDWRKLENTC